MGTPPITILAGRVQPFSPSQLSRAVDPRTVAGEVERIDGWVPVEGKKGSGGVRLACPSRRIATILEQLTLVRYILLLASYLSPDGLYKAPNCITPA